MRAAVIVVTTVAALLGARSDRAGAQIALAPPWDTAARSGFCLDGFGSTGDCQHSAQADAGTGAVSLTIAAESPEGGREAGAVVGSAIATFTGHHVLTQPVPAILYTASLDATSVRVMRSGGNLPGVVGGEAWVTLTASASHDSCTCDGYGSATVLSTSYGSDARTNQSFPLWVVLFEREGGSVPAGTVTIQVQVGVNIRLNDKGSVSAAAEGTVRLAWDPPTHEETLLPAAATSTPTTRCDATLPAMQTTCDATVGPGGAVDIDLEVRSPHELVPGDGSAYANTRHRAVQQLGVPVRAVVFVGALHVDSAWVETPDLDLPPLNSWASLSGSALVNPPPGSYADSTHWSVLSASGGDSRTLSDADFRFAFGLTGRQGALLVGTYELALNTTGYAWLEQDPGRVRAGLAGQYGPVRALVFV